MPYTSTKLPSGTWRAGFRHPVTGKPVRTTKDDDGRPFAYQWEADAWAVIAEERAQRAANGASPAATAKAPASPSEYVGPTLAEYGAVYLQRRAAQHTRATRAWYANHLERLSITVSDKAAPLGKMPVGRIRYQHVEQWQTDTQAAGFGHPTINHRLALVRMIDLDMIRSDDFPITNDPTEGIKFLPEDQGPDRIVNRTEEDLLLAAASPQTRAAMMTALDAGLRCQEVYALRPVAFMNDGEFLFVSHVVERGSHELRAYPKGKRKRIVPATERLALTLAPFIEAARERGGEEALIFPTMGNPAKVAKARREDLLAGRLPWDYSNFRNREWCPAMYAAGFGGEEWRETGRVRKTGPEAGTPVRQRRLLVDFGFHALRHTYGSRLAAAGVPTSEIATLMGHADETTTKRYIHTGTDGRRRDLVRAALATPQTPALIAVA